ncbi:MAG: acetate--CoA ligase family protein [Acidimicrobiia bacterium]|nr:acetate--CoA ligase family protein [Acidimicrobiia bacterium]
MSLARLLNPRSIAIVGASDKVGPGFNAWKALEAVGYAGDIHLINPNKPELLGRGTFPSVAAVPGPLDAVFVAIQQEAVLDVLRQAGAKGAGGAVVLSSGFGEAGPAGEAAQRELAEIAARHGMAVVGPNCLGFLNFAGRVALFGTSLPDAVPRGGVAAVLHSGSIAIALLNAARGIGFSHVITSGNEAVTTAADFLEALVEDTAVKVLVVFLEQLRNPAKFIAVARRARTLAKPMIVLKTGRSERGREAVRAHTGALAGSDEVCRAAFAAAGIIQASTLDELIETTALAAALPEAPKASGVAMLSLSGGEIALALDNAEPAELTFAPLTTAKDEIASLLPPYAHIANPLDLTWAGLYDASVAERCARALGWQADVGLLALLQDSPHGLGPQQAARYANLLGAVARGAKDAGKPLVAVSNLAGETHPTYAQAAAAAGVPCLRGTQEGLFALARYLRWATTELAPVVAGGSAGEKREAARRLKGLPAGRAPAEHEARAVIEAYGIRGPRQTLVVTPVDAAVAARALGFPVVLKGMVADMLHKSDAGLVKVNLRSEVEVRAVAEAMAATSVHGAWLGFLVQEMLKPVAELFVGARIDPDFGPAIAVGGGGVLVELYRDVAVRPAPVDEATARAMLAETRASKLLRGWRGNPPADIAAAARAVAQLSRFAADFRSSVAEVEINPLAVFAEGWGCAALDCVIVPRPL